MIITVANIYLVPVTVIRNMIYVTTLSNLKLSYLHGCNIVNVGVIFQQYVLNCYGYVSARVFSAVLKFTTETKHLT